MAFSARTFMRALGHRTGDYVPTLSGSRLPVITRTLYGRQSRRAFVSSANSSRALFYGSLATAGVAGGSSAYFFKFNLSTTRANDTQIAKESSTTNDYDHNIEFFRTKDDYQKVYDAIAQRLIDEDDYDDGSYGPVLVRLAWHSSGTYDKETGTGGSNGATMRFDPEGGHGANAGLKAARDFLEPIKDQFPWITYSDLWTLGGVTAVQEMLGPTIPWRAGRSDRDISFCTPDGRLPDGSRQQDHLRAIFYRMGFDDREIVALSGGHALGRCHTDRSGFEGPWTFSPTIFTNDYFKFLIDEKWITRDWDGPKQYQNESSKSLMMLPTDISLIKDDSFRPHVERFARDGDAFYTEFADAFVKLLELGVPFQGREDSRMTFTPSS